MAKSNIEWADVVWNPVIGCKKVSGGCQNCYAEKMSVRLSAMNNKCSPDYVQILRYAENGKPLGFNGKVKCLSDRLDQPLRWKKPRMIFVNSMSDLFHPDVPFKFILECFNMMNMAKQHTFQILTKRPERMLEFMSWFQQVTKHEIECILNTHIWLGVSIEDQKTANERITLLLQTPAAVRWISVEPLLGGIDLMNIKEKYFYCNSLKGEIIPRDPLISAGIRNSKLHWVVVGGESGPKARPMHPSWVRSIRDQCKAADVPFFFKQGSKANWNNYKNFDSFPKDLQIREYPDV